MKELRWVTFDVVGIPAQQGSKRAFVRGGKAVMVEDAKTLGSWRAMVADAARAQAAVHGRLDGPLALTVNFRFPCPPSRRKAHRERAATYLGAPKTTTPDLDKLVRAIGDALTAGGLIADDARLWLIMASKVETFGWCGAEITVGDHL